MNAYSDKDKKDIFDNICELIISGKSLRKAIDNVKISCPTFFEWIREDELKSKQYARATVERAELMAEDMLDIADEAPRFTDTKFGTAVDNGDVQYKRLRVDTRKWALSKMMPKKYGLNPEEENNNSDNEIIIKIVE